MMNGPFDYWFGLFSGVAMFGVPWVLYKVIDASYQRMVWRAGTDQRLRNLEDRMDRLEGRPKQSRDGAF